MNNTITASGVCTTNTVTTNQLPNFTTTTATVMYPSWGTMTPTYVETNDYYKFVENISKKVEELENKKKETEKMNVINFPKFGPITDDSVRYSSKGIAAKNNDGEYVVFNADTNGIENVSVFALKGNFFYLMPVAMKDVALEDIILHQKHYCYVIDGDETSLTVIDLITNEQRVVYPSQSPFGFNYVSKVVSLMDYEPASKDNPFGNMALMMMLQEGNNKDILPFLLMNKNGDMKDILPYLMMCK